MLYALIVTVFLQAADEVPVVIAPAPVQLSTEQVAELAEKVAKHVQPPPSNNGLGEYGPIINGTVVGFFMIVFLWVMKTGFPRLMDKQEASLNRLTDKHEAQVNRLLDTHAEESQARVENFMTESRATREWHEREVTATREDCKGERQLFREVMRNQKPQGGS